MANGANQGIDPKVAPQGAIARVQDLRIDQRGRLVPRSGYTALPSTIADDAPGALVPRDLHEVDGRLVALGHHRASVQSGIRAAYVHTGSPAGEWRTPFDGNSVYQTKAFFSLPAASDVRIMFSDRNVTAVSPSVADPDINTADTAITADKRYVALACGGNDFFGEYARLTIIDLTTEEVVAELDTSFGVNAEAYPRVLAIGQVFYLFTQTATQINVRTVNMAVTPYALSALTALVGAITRPCAYDVANVEGSTDYLVSFATAAGCNWIRRTSAHGAVSGAAIASVAFAPSSVCGSAINNTVTVLSVRAVDGAELRSYNATTSALLVGPTNLGTAGEVVVWVSIALVATGIVHCRFLRETPFRRVRIARVTTAAHVVQAQERHEYLRPVTKAFFANGQAFVWESPNTVAPVPYLLSSVGMEGSIEANLAGSALDGLAKTVWGPRVISSQGAVSHDGGTRYFVGLIGKDPRDNTFRAFLVSFEVFSDKRRQGAIAGGTLYLAGGNAAQWDGQLPAEIGHDVSPEILALTLFGAGMPSAGTYTYHVIFRSVGADGKVTQSAPSPPKSITVPAGVGEIDISWIDPHGLRLSPAAFAAGQKIFADIYRTEAGGSIPRFLKSVATQRLNTYGGSGGVRDDAPDSVVQAGAPMYTQGADGSVSGRLPLGLASPCSLITESDGKLLIAGLERDTQLHISIEGRPGEQAGFVNDDLFFIQNPERITAIAASEDGRRFIFGRKNIRELVGTGPNAAGVGDIANPVEIESRVGCGDWRSLCKTEHGIFFRTASNDRPGIYLLPRGGSQAMEVSEGIDYLLRDFPVVTSATRHEEEQLVTFTLQNLAGTDGRLVHLDLKMSGLDPKRGWQGAWIVDRVPLFEGIPDIEIVSQEQQVYPQVSANPTVLTVPLPKGRRLGDRIVFVFSTGAPFATSGVANYTFLGSQTTSSGYTIVYERILSTQPAVQSSSFAIFVNGTSGGVSASAIVTIWLLRNTHPSQQSVLSSLFSNASITSYALPTLTPPWGSAKNLWLLAANADSTFFNTTPGTAGPARPVFAIPSAGFELFRNESTAQVSVHTFQNQSTASRLLEAASLSGVTFDINPVSGGATGAAFLIAVRPRVAVAGASPIRASAQYKNRLYVCNSTTVFRSDPEAFSDAGTQISPEWESCDIYPMGVGGEGRHLSVLLLAEVLGYCDVTCWYSYDNADTWVRGVTYQITPTFGYGIGSTIRLLWTPYRRKIQGVRVKFTVQDSVNVPQGTTRGLAFFQTVMMFEDLAGPARLTAAQRGNTGI
jgi:hypothetical protein